MYINSPYLLRPTLQSKTSDTLFFAGQIAGTEGYVGSVASGLLAGVNAARIIESEALLELPERSMAGALMRYIAHAAAEDFQPMKANFGLLPPLERRVRGKRKRAAAQAERALQEMRESLGRGHFA
jgi:methylenetetrahydrofolate--tRNA-(uracil-5-)-methyltransferase